MLAPHVHSEKEIQLVVREIGQRHFSPTSDAGVGYSTFFMMQVLAGMFENAVAWLYTYNYVTAVHFAIAVGFYGLLRVSPFEATASELCKSFHLFLLVHYNN